MPTTKEKQEREEERKEAMKAITWDISNESDSIKESSGSDVANLCLMGLKENDNEVNTSFSTSSAFRLSYDELLHACDELQNELSNLGKKYKDLKKKYSNISNENVSFKNKNDFFEKST